jgi:hypothetical protein
LCVKEDPAQCDSRMKMSYWLGGNRKIQHRMLRTGGLRRTRASELVWCAVNARGSKPEICWETAFWAKKDEDHLPGRISISWLMGGGPMGIRGRSRTSDYWSKSVADPSDHPPTITKCSQLRGPVAGRLWVLQMIHIFNLRDNVRSDRKMCMRVRRLEVDYVNLQLVQKEPVLTISPISPAQKRGVFERGSQLQPDSRENACQFNK